MEFHLTGVWGWVVGVIIMFVVFVTLITGAIIIVRILFEWIADTVLRLSNGFKLFTRYVVYREEFWKWYKSRNNN